MSSTICSMSMYPRIHCMLSWTDILTSSFSIFSALVRDSEGKNHLEGMGHTHTEECPCKKFVSVAIPQCFKAPQGSLLHKHLLFTV